MARRDPAEVTRRIDAFATAQAAGKNEELKPLEFRALGALLVDAIRGVDDLEVPGYYPRMIAFRDAVNGKIRGRGQGGTRSVGNG